MINEVPGTIKISQERSGDGCEILVVVSKIECIWVNEDKTEVNIRTTSGEVETALFGKDEADTMEAFIRNLTSAIVG